MSLLIRPGRCFWCEEKLLSGPACTYPSIKIDGVYYARLPYGWECWPVESGSQFDAMCERRHKLERCPDCGTPLRGLHHFCCELEQCPRCRDRLLGCQCSQVERVEPGCSQPLSLLA